MPRLATILAASLATLPWVALADSASQVCLVKDFNTELTDDGPSPSHLAALGDRLVFVAGTRTLGAELWISDGTAQGTTLLKDITPGIRDSFPKQLTTVDDRVFFQAEEPETAVELWVTDGTEAGTRRLGEVGPRASPSGSDELVALGDQVFFAGSHDETGVELWMSDGTEAGTVLVKDL